MGTSTEVEFRVLTIPDSVDAADAADFVAMVEVRNEIYRQISGHNDHFISAAEILPHYRPTPHERRLGWLVLEDGRPVGRLGLDLLDEGERNSAIVLIELLQEAWGRGIGNAGLEVIEAAAKADGRTILQSWVEHPDVPGPRLVPPSGFGSIAAEGHAARFLSRRGFTLEQIERNSAFDLTGSFDAVEQLLEEARAASGDYRVVQWSAPTPEEFIEGYAWVKSRMSTDVPSAGLDVDEETWDADRVRIHDARFTETGRILHVTAAQHIATGELCAFNELVIGADRSEASHQEDTLVLQDHRGHRLGALVKCENLLTWREIAPDSPRIITYNAEENRPMLSINEAIGFVPIAYEGAWKKVLTQ